MRVRRLEAEIRKMAVTPHRASSQYGQKECQYCGKPIQRMGFFQRWAHVDATPPGAQVADDFVPHGSLNLRWNDSGSLSCIHGDDLVSCHLPGHVTIPTFVRRNDLLRGDNQ